MKSSVSFHLHVGNGIDLFEKSFDDDFARHDSFHELEWILVGASFCVKSFDSFVDDSSFDPSFDWELCCLPKVMSTNIGTCDSFYELEETMVDVLWDFEPCFN